MADDLSWLTPTLPAAPAAQGRGLIASIPGALASGFEQAAGQLSSAVGGVGQLLGSQTLTDLGARGAANSEAEAQSYANPAYEGSPFQGGLGHVIPWAIYNAIKMAPQLAAPVAGAALAPEAEIAGIGAKVLGGAAAAAPQAFGTAMQATGDPYRALAMTPALAALQAWLPGHADALIANAAGKGGLKGIAMAGLATAAVQAPAAGVQTALVDAANPTLSAMDRVHNIVDSTISGGVLGGFFGAGGASFGALRGMKRVDAASVSTEDLGKLAQLPAPGNLSQPQEPVMTGTTAGVRIGEQNVPPVASEFDQAPVTPRPFKGMTDAELKSANNVLSAKGEDITDEHARIKSLIQDELTHRANQPLITPDAQSGVGAVTRTEDGKSGVADQGSSAPVPATFGDRLNDLKQGANTAWGRQVDAKDELDLATKVAERLDSHPSNSLTEFAVRIGLLDGADPTKVTPLAAAVEQAKAGSKDEASLAAAKGETTAPAAPANGGGGDRPVDAEFQKQFAEDLSSRRGVALKDLRENPPANADDARERLYDLLAKGPEHPDINGKDGYQAVVDLAKQHGVLDANGRYTEAAGDIARKGITMEDAVQEAQGRGLSGAEASAFDKGARGQREVTLGSIDELKAYNDGRDWSKPADVAVDNPKAGDGHAMPEDQGKRVTSVGIPDEQRNMQFLNQAIDQVYGSTLKPQEQAQLKRMVREGANSKQIDDAARYFSSGHGALVQEQPPARPFVGETVTRGAPRDPARLAAIRGQDVLRSASTASADESQLQASKRLIADHQQRKDLLRQEISGSLSSGDINQLEAIRLHALLGKNDLQGVVDRLPGGRLHGDQPDTGQFMNALAERAVVGHEYNAPDRIAASPALRLKMMTGDIGGSLKEIANNSTSPMYKLIARKLDGDWHQGVTLTREAYDPLRTGRSILNPDGSQEIKLFGERGMSEETFLHEVLHAFVQNKFTDSIEGHENIVRRRITSGTGFDRPAALPRGSAVLDRVNALHDQIRNAMEKAFPELTSNAIWANQVHASPDEMISWVMTNPEAQEALKRIDINGDKISETGKGSLWDQFKGFISDLLGIPSNGRTMSALDHILQAGHSLLDAQEQVDAAAHVPAPVINDRLTAAVGLAAKEGAEGVKNLLERTSDFRGKVFKAALKTMHGTHLVEEFAERRPVVPEIKEWQDVLNQKNGIANELSKPQLVATDRITKLMRDDPKNAERVNKAMLAAASGRNAELPWAKQTWLHKDPQAGLLKQMADAEYRDFHAMSPQAREAYYGDKNMLEAVGRVHMIQRLQLLITHDASLKPLADKVGDPVTDYVSHTDKHSPEGAVEFFRDGLNKMLNDIQQHFAQSRNDPTLVQAQREELERHLGPVEAEMASIRDQLGAITNSPYFHLYREGDHMVAAKLRVDTKGRADPASVRAAADMLAKAGFSDVHISPDLSNPQLFMLVDTKGQRRLAERALQQLGAKGHVDPDSILAGPNSARQALMSDGSKLAMEHLLAEVKGNPVFATEGKTPADAATIDAQREAVEKVVREAWLNSLPTNSLARVMAHRSMVQGFSKDMALSTANRLSVGISAAARMWARPKLNEVFTRMNDRARNSLNINDAQHKDVDLVHTLTNEVRQRDVQQLSDGQHDWTDTLRIVSNVFHLAASPVQAVIDFTQLPVLVVPHLGARHGYANTLSAMAKVTPTALRVVREAFNQGRAVSATRAMDLSVTHDVLVKAIPDKATRDFVEHVMASGIIDTGSNVRALTRDSGINPNPKMQTMLTWATVLEQSNEMANRLITALAARELHGGKMAVSAEDYAKRTINDTLGQYQSSNAPPILTKKGPLKFAGPLLFQFKNFSINLMWKLYREAHSALDKSLPEEDRANGRKFLMGHAVAVTAIAGSLGMPFAGAAAGVVDKLKDELFPSEHPFDAIAAYRNFLADVFGKDLGEVIAKGVPRSLGLDLSSRVGEEDLLPFTQFLTDRRTWSDTLNEWGAQAVGAPLSMAYQEARGIDQIHNGNIIGGAASMMPSSIRHAMQAYQMTQHGYVDSNGIPMPMASPGAGDILAQLVGVTPADKAEYQDDREVQMNARASLTREANSLKSQIVRALVNGDNETARAGIVRAQRFDAANPAYAVLPRVESAVVNTHRDEAISAATQTPMGVNPKDLYARGLTQGFSTVDYKAQ